MTDEQITAAFLSVLGIPPRPADLQVLGLIGRDPESVAEYLWDHMLGEPDTPSLAEVAEAVKEATVR